MQIERSHHGAVTLLKPRGSVAQDEADAFRSSLVECMRSSMGRCVVDFSATSFIDSRGLETLVDVGEDLTSRGQSLRVCGVSSTIGEAMELTGVAAYLDRYDGVQSAVRSFL